MKRSLSIFLSISCLLGLLAGCGGQASTATTAPNAPSTEGTTAPTEASVSQAAMDALNGKKILFIGNSYTHAAHAVIDKGFNPKEQEKRVDTRGYFYQLCKRAGMDVTVTSWCFGNHNVTDTFGDSCHASQTCEGVDHKSYFVDPVFDYVSIQCYKEPLYEGDLVAHLQPIVDFFRAANPDVKFLLQVPHMAYDRPFDWVKDVEKMADNGFIVCNWGGLVYDVVNKTVEVPGATQQYFRNTFVVSISESDGHHQNILAGYLTALMTYCAITGDSAVGQPYDFCADPTVDKKFVDLETYVAERYTYDKFTNMIEVFQSPADMAGLQQLVDQYIVKYN